MPKTKRKTVIVLVAAAVLIAVAGVAWWLWPGGGRDTADDESQGRPPVTVAAAPARTDHWRPAVTSVGSLRAVRGVDVTSEVPGQVVAVSFASGQRVDEGAVLLRLDTAVLEAERRRLEEELALARTQLARTRELASENVAPEAELDRAQAEVRALEARLQAQQARLEERVIRAPFAGVVGIDRIDEGAYVQPGEPLVTLRQLDPIRVDFSLPQQALARVAEGQAVEVRVDAWPDRVFTGDVVAIDPQVAEASRTISIEAALDNADRALRPGMFVDVRVLTGAAEAQVTVPRSAISYNPYGDFVYIVGDDQTVARRFIETGPRRDSRVAIVDGVSTGDRVVTAGTHKLQDGARVRVDEAARLPTDGNGGEG